MNSSKLSDMNALKSIRLPKALLYLVVVFASAGLMTLFFTRASAPNVSIEAENGTITGGAERITGNNLSYVKFTNPSEAKTIVAAGDLVKPGSTLELQKALQASDLAISLNPDAYFLLGDLAYGFGSRGVFRGSYSDRWGRSEIFNKTYPAPGNHEYLLDPRATDPGDLNNYKTRDDPAKPYFDYYASRLPAGNAAARQAYYSFNLGKWRIIVLDSECTLEFVEGVTTQRCGVGTPQYNWLLNELANNQETASRKCTLAFWHKPRFAWYHGETNDNVRMKPMWDLLYDHGLDVALVGHTHDYIRYNPLDKNLNFDQRRGITQFIVGTGGAGLTDMNSTLPDKAVTFNDKDHGVLYATLRSDRFSYEFKSIPGKTYSDRGEVACH